MSIATLTQVYDEARRLAIAGSNVAPGDFRLQKLVAPLEQAGAKAPVFAKIAQSVQAVVNSAELSAASNLLELTTLVSAVLYTQGATGIEGEIGHIPTVDLDLESTQTSARTIKPLLEALHSTGSGRLEIIRDAVEKNLFRDIRLIRAAVRAIDDSYPEIADLVVKRVLPLYGAAILPDLRSTFEIKSKAIGHTRRLLLMHQLDPVATRALVEQTLAEGSKELKVAAIECLGESEADSAYLIEQSKARAKDVRAAALRAMIRAPRRSEESIQVLLKALAGEDVELLIRALVDHRIPALDDAVIAQLGKQVDQLFEEADSKRLGAAIQRAIHLTLCLQGVRDSRAEQLLLDLFARAAKIAKLKGEPSGADLNETVAICMSDSSEKVKRHLAEQAGAVSGCVFQAALRAAYDLYPADAFYQTFHPMLEALQGKKRAVDLERGEMLEQLLMDRFERRFNRFRDDFELLQRPPRQLDPRWLDRAVELQRRELVFALFVPGHSAAADFLVDTVTSKQPSWLRMVALERLASIKDPRALDLLIKTAEAQKSEDWHVRYGLQKVIALLPTAAAKALEEALPRISPKLADVVIEAIGELKLKTE